jgi:hypothetical protein
MQQDQNINPADLAKSIEYSEKYMDDTYEYRCAAPGVARLRAG